MLFLVNGPKKGSRAMRAKMARVRAGKKASTTRGSSAPSKRKKVKARRSASTSSKTRRLGAKMATRKKRVRRRKAVARRASPTRRKRRVTRKRPSVSVQRRGVTVYRSNPRKRRRSRRYRRNPGLSARGILGQVQKAGMDALGVLGGLAATNLIARRIPFGDGNKAVEIGKKIAVALALGMVARKAASSALAEKIVVGGMVAVGIDLLRDVPMVGTALAGDADLRYLSRGVSAYPTTMLTDGMGAWIEPGVTQKGALEGYYN